MSAALLQLSASLVPGELAVCGGVYGLQVCYISLKSADQAAVEDFCQSAVRAESLALIAPVILPRRNLRELLEELIAIASVTRGKQDLHINLLPVGEEFDPAQ